MKLLQTKDYLLWVDEEAEIKENDLMYDEKLDIIINYKSYNDGCVKIIGHYPLTKEAKELDLPLLPPFEDPLKTLINSFNQNYNRRGEYYLGLVDGAKLGYKAAQSKQLELLKRAIQLASDAENIEEVTEEIIQSLSTQQLPKEFIPEYEADISNSPYTSNKYNKALKALKESSKIGCKLKTITNSKGKEVLVGTYKY